MKPLDEFSGVASMASTVKGTKHMASLSRHPDDPKSSRGKSRDKKKKKRNRKKNEGALHSAIVEALFDEIVKKKGNSWKLYDDDTKAEIGSYKDRKAAWNAQRVKRAQAKATKAAKRKQSAKSTTAHLNKQGKKVMDKKKKRKNESFESVLARALLESSPYVFEQPPSSEDAAGWDAFVGRMSHEVMHSDPKLKNMLLAHNKARLAVLQQAHDAIAQVLHKTKQFEVGKPKLQKQGESGEPVLMFDVQILGDKKKVPIGIVIQHDKPVFSIPEQTKALLNSMATKESKLLRAELMHVQETVLDHMHDITKAAEKRNGYLRNKESKIDKLVTGMDPVQVAILRKLMKGKFKGFQ